jgi:hypothetical protein
VNRHIPVRPSTGHDLSSRDLDYKLQTDHRER